MNKKEIWNWIAYLWDCLEVLKKIEDKSINLIVIDPPYNICKDKTWDKWKTVNAYVEFMWKVFLECQRVLKDNWSFYFFHNDFLQIVELQNWLNNNSKFVFKQLIVWNKKFKWCSNEWFLQWFNEVEWLRNYQKMTEYCLYYTFQDETGLKVIWNDWELYKPIRDYFQEERKKTNLSYKEINEKCFWTASNWWGMASNILTSYKKWWTFPTKEKYEALQKVWICKKEYESLRQEYESLRQEYESLRYTFNNQKTHHSVWDYEIAKKQWHITPKPVDLIENIIKYSSNEWDLVLDCFSWSFTTAVACENLNRKWIWIEMSEEYYNIWINRIKENKKRIEKDEWYFNIWVERINNLLDKKNNE